MNIDVAKQRAKLLSWVRAFFNEKNYLEIDTPILVPCPGAEVHMDYFETTWLDYQSKAHDLWLRSSPELHLKQALASGAPKVFEIAKCFRNSGELSKLHQPEFTMLEWYEAGLSYKQMIQMTEDFIQESAQIFNTQIHKTTHLTVAEVFKDFANIELQDQDQDLAQKAIAAGVISIEKSDDFETAYFKTLIEVIEPKLQQLENVVLYDYPASQAALAEVEGGVAKRFEFYIKGVEVCNGYQELTDLNENINRFQQINEQRKAIGKKPLGNDPNFTSALKTGIPSCCGNALGLDRLLCLVQGQTNLNSAIPFREQYPFENIWDQ